jgi:hypothetical protein
MKRFVSPGAWTCTLVLFTTSCGPNITPLEGDPFELTMLADFENGQGFNPNPLWDGAFANYVDNSVVPPGHAMKFEVATLSPPRETRGGTKSTQAIHASDEGRYTVWGTLVYADLKNRKAVNLGGFLGFSIWARSAGLPGTTVKVGIADYGSFNDVADLPQLCDLVDTSGPNACYDDYATKIYPDGVWRRYDIPFSSLTTGGYGYPHAFDPTRVYRVKLSMLASTMYDLWFDDAAFYTERSH